MIDVGKYEHFFRKGCNFWHGYSSDPRKYYRICDFDLRGHLRSPEVNNCELRSKVVKRLSEMQFFACILI